MASILELFKSIHGKLSICYSVMDISSFHYDLLLTGFTGLITLSKVFQLNWEAADWFELLNKQNRILTVFIITTIILSVLLLIDYLVHYKEEINKQVPITHALTVLIFLNSLAMFITFVTLYSQQDRKIGVEMSFLNVVAGYLIPVLSFTGTFIYSLHTYIYGSEYEEQLTQVVILEKRQRALEERLEDLKNTKESGSCLIM